MCNLYSQTTAVEAMRRIFGVARGGETNLPARPAIFPGGDAPIIRPVDGERELVTMSWGFVLPQQERAPKRVTNARDDKVRSSGFWRGSFDERRCLVPVSSFCEPKGKAPAVWHWFALQGEPGGDEPRPPFAFAGLWRPWRGELKGEMVELDVFAFLTTTPNAIVKPVHQSRMPVILDPGDYETWLTGSPDDAFALAKPFPAERMRIVKAGDEKSDAA